MRDLSGWLKRRLRQYFWKQWKLSRTKRESLIQLGLDEKKHMNGQTSERDIDEYLQVIFFIGH